MSHKSINREAEAALTYSDLTYLLHYDLLTGIFTWKVQMSATALAGNIAGSPHPKLGHIGIQINMKRYLAHRLAWFYVYKVWPIGVIDHKDRNSQNNAIDNLRDVTQIVNMQNSRLRKDNTSGEKGVARIPYKGWRARIVVNKKEIHLGMFPSKEAAIVARKLAEKKYYDFGD